jgi:hypothetical protein
VLPYDSETSMGAGTMDAADASSPAAMHPPLLLCEGWPASKRNIPLQQWWSNTSPWHCRAAAADGGPPTPHYLNPGLCRERVPLGTGLNTLGTACDERELSAKPIRHRWVGKWPSAVSHRKNTRQMCREPHLTLVTDLGIGDGVSCGPTSLLRSPGPTLDTSGSSAMSHPVALGTAVSVGGPGWWWAPRLCREPLTWLSVKN